MKKGRPSKDWSKTLSYFPITSRELSNKTEVCISTAESQIQKLIKLGLVYKEWNGKATLTYRRV